MSALIYITLLNTLSYHCAENFNNFKGRSEIAGAIIGLIAGIGNITTWITLIWSFWHFTWWQPIAAYFASMIIGALTAPLFQRNIFGSLATPILTITLAVLSVVALCKL